MNTDRREFAVGVKRAALARANGKCEGCGGPLAGQPIRYDHRIPDFFSKDNSVDNCQVLGRICCDTKKTKQDQKDIAKSRRIIKKRLGLAKPKKKIQSRGFQGSRKFNGETTWRK